MLSLTLPIHRGARLVPGGRDRGVSVYTPRLVPHPSSLFFAAFLVTVTVTGSCRGSSVDLDEAGRQSARIAAPATRAAALEATRTLFERTLAESSGRPDAPAVEAFRRVTTRNIVAGYRASRRDPGHAIAALELLATIGGPGAAPAWIEACEAERPDHARHALLAARGIAVLGSRPDVPAAKKVRLARALRIAFQRVPGQRDGDGQGASDADVHRAIVQALISLGPAAQRDVATLYLGDLHEVAPDVALALAHQLVELASPAVIPALVRGLFDRRDCVLGPMKELAREGLARAGPPGIEALLRVARLEDRRAIEVAGSTPQYVVRPDGTAGELVSAESVARITALRALAELEAPEAVPLLLAGASQGSVLERYTHLVLLARLVRVTTGREDEVRARTLAWLDAASTAEYANQRGHVLNLPNETFDGGLLPTLLAHIEDADEVEATRVAAVNTYASLAYADEVALLRARVTVESAGAAGALKNALDASAPALEAASRCDRDRVCWARELDSTDAKRVRKATAMLARLGDSDTETIASFVALLDHRDMDVRLGAIRAIDHVAIEGSSRAVARIRSLASRPESDESRRFNPAAVTLARRLIARGRPD